MTVLFDEGRTENCKCMMQGSKSVTIKDRAESTANIPGMKFHNSTTVSFERHDDDLAKVFFLSSHIHRPGFVLGDLHLINKLVIPGTNSS